MCEYTEESTSWEGPIDVQHIRDKQGWLADDQGKNKQFSTAQLLPEAQSSDDRVLEREMRHLRTVVQPNILRFDDTVPLTETLHPADRRGQSQEFRSSKHHELAGRTARNSFQLVPRAATPK